MNTYNLQTVMFKKNDLIYKFWNELFYHFLSFTKVEELNNLKHWVMCIGREKMHTAIPHNITHSS